MKLFAISVICPDLSRLGDFAARFIGIISRNRDGAYCIAPLSERDAALYRRRLTYFYLRHPLKILVLGYVRSQRVRVNIFNIKGASTADLTRLHFADLPFFVLLLIRCLEGGKNYDEI